MKHFHLTLSAGVAIALILIGADSYWLNDLALVIGGVFAGHVLTEALNDPSD